MDYKNITKSNYKVRTQFLATLKLASFLLVLALVGCNSSADVANDTPKEDFPLAESLARVDELFKSRDNVQNMRDSITVLQRIRQSDPKNFDAAWKLSRAYFYVGKYSTDEAESAKALEEGVGAANIAIRIGPERPDGYFWLGANQGENVKRNPVTGLGSIGSIRESMEKVISLNPGYEGASAYDGLAQIELQTLMIGGSANKAVELMERQSRSKKEIRIYICAWEKRIWQRSEKQKRKSSLRWL